MRLTSEQTVGVVAALIMLSGLPVSAQVAGASLRQGDAEHATKTLESELTGADRATLEKAHAAKDWPLLERLARSVLAPSGKGSGARDQDAAEALSWLGKALNGQKRYPEAEASFRRALELRKTTLGEQHLATAKSYVDLAGNLWDEGRYADAEPLYRKALEVRGSALGEHHVETAAIYNDLAATLHRLGRYAEAETFHRKALEGRKSSLGERHLDVASSYDELAGSLRAQSRYDEVVTLHSKALEIREALLGAQHPDVADSLNSIATNLDEQGRHTEAEPLHRRGLEIKRKVLGERHVRTAWAYRNLAVNLRMQGRLDEADPLYRKALNVQMAQLGERHAETVWTLNGMAMNLDDQGKVEEAEPLYRKVLAIRRATLGEQDTYTALSYSNLGTTLFQQGRYEEAEPFLRNALETYRKLLGEQNPLTATVASNLSLNVHAQGRYGEAEQLALSALKAAEKRRIRERSAGSGASFHSTNGSSQTIYLDVAWDRAGGDEAHVPRLRSQAFRAAQDLQSSSAGQALAQAATRIAAGAGPLAEAVRRRQDLASAHAAQDAALLQAIASRDAAGADVLRAKLQQSEDALARLDMEIKAQFPQYVELEAAPSLSLAEVQAKLEPDEGLLLIVEVEENVHVFAVAKAATVWSRVDGGRGRVGTLVAALRCELDPQTCVTGATDGNPGDVERRSTRTIRVTSSSAGVRSFDTAPAAELHAGIIAPMEPNLTAVKRLYVVPSGALANLPLGVLLDTSGPEPVWLADRYAVTTLPSVSSLRAFPDSARERDQRTIFAGFGDPVLSGGSGDARSAAPSLFRASAEGQGVADVGAIKVAFAALPGTRRELEAMAEALEAPPGALRLGPDATEAAVKSAPELGRAEIIAFATHGFLPSEIKGLDEPGLVFTPPEEPTREDDGVLTASEAATLNLRARWVILSACNTAAAGGAEGESLSGLAKAFLYAGAQALLVSHWRVGDQSTALLTVETLQAQARDPKLTKAQALQQAMKTLRTGKRPDGKPLPGWTPDMAHPSAWAPFTIVADQDRP